MKRISLHIICSLLVLAWVAVADPPQLTAATNAVTAGIGGLNNGTLSGGDGTGTGRITINTVDLALVKQARDSLGNLLPDGANVAPGQEIYFVIYVDNSTSVPAVDIQISDALNETEFTYVPGSLEYQTAPTGTSIDAIWALGWSAVSDAVDAGDAASAADSGAPAGLDRITAGQVAGQANKQLDIPGSELWVLRFRVTIN
jgi:uncharacterized repeat protein (TIGR01451 family)